MTNHCHYPELKGEPENLKNITSLCDETHTNTSAPYF